jgi:hypothetical protein
VSLPILESPGGDPAKVHLMKREERYPRIALLSTITKSIYLPFALFIVSQAVLTASAGAALPETTAVTASPNAPQ